MVVLDINKRNGRSAACQAPPRSPMILRGARRLPQVVEAMASTDGSGDTAAAASSNDDLAGGGDDSGDQNTPTHQAATSQSGDDEKSSSSSSDKEDGEFISYGEPIIVTPEEADHSGHAEASHEHHGSGGTEIMTSQDVSEETAGRHDSDNQEAAASQDAANDDSAGATNEFHDDAGDGSVEATPGGREASAARQGDEGLLSKLADLIGPGIFQGDAVTQMIRGEVARVYHEYHALTDGLAIAAGGVMVVEAVAVGTVVDGIVVLTTADEIAIVGGLTFGGGQILSGGVNLLSHMSGQDSVKSTHDGTAYASVPGLSAGFTTAVLTGNHTYTQMAASIMSAMPIPGMPGPSAPALSNAELLRNSADTVDAVSDAYDELKKAGKTEGNGKNGKGGKNGK